MTCPSGASPTSQPEPLIVTPPFYRQDIELLVDALKPAASMQQREGQEVAGRLALGAIALFILLGFGTYPLSVGKGGGSA